MWTNLDRPPLDEAALRKALVAGAGAPADPRSFWRRLDVVAETGSTNADLLDRALRGDADRHVLLAEYQSGPRGRHARPWVSPRQAQISMSAVLTMPGRTLSDMGWLPLLTGVAVVDALRSIADVPAELKWPNDVLIGGRKVAGILAEVASAAPDPTAVVGVGLNVSLTADELPVPTATSLVLEHAATADRDTLVRGLARALAQRWSEWAAAGWDVEALADAYRARCATIGQSVRAELPGGRVLLGTAVDIDRDGRLVVQTDDGTRTAVAAGDITHVRAVER
ncbi:biotin--[acetyl-CoA-carboxylase] ligase [Rhodococcus sp. HNM0569]|uniref:biotin--[acetyl-CoA-carboxylase] ligase n=1 Tax=Rhodococcus sp. HNM0569 TaxID=2716340 RepID=UPI00146D6D5C|nr:biotin--[acetyl-CoA-carboxylase] ligase [Rhodococcus sp. HNM0569]NLU81891.1 biotin--[acetyl-CoA-carboxylase] ligase [Rhodococcus sp. HNM0569]